MSANGRGGMRPQSRSPPFLLIGLLVALVILAANYWSLSSNNASLSNEVSELQDQIRLLSTKNINSEKRNSKAMNENQELKLSAVQKEEEMKKRVKEVENLQAEFTKKQEEVLNLNQERDKCQSDLKSCQSNSDGIQKELELLKEDISNLKKVTPENCTSTCGKLKLDLLSQIEKFVGLQVLKTLHTNGVDVMEYKDKVQNLPDTIQNLGAQAQQSNLPSQNLIAQQQGNGTVNNQQVQTGAPAAGIPAVPAVTGSPVQGALSGAGAINPPDQNMVPVNQAESGKVSGQVVNATKEGERKEEAQPAVEQAKKDAQSQGKEEAQPSIPVIPGAQHGGNITAALQNGRNAWSGVGFLSAFPINSSGNNNSLKIGFLGKDQIHPPNIEEMNRIMKDAVKDTIQESLNKALSKDGKLPDSSGKEIVPTIKDGQNDLSKVEGGRTEAKGDGGKVDNKGVGDQEQAKGVRDLDQAKGVGDLDQAKGVRDLDQAKGVGDQEQAKGVRDMDQARTEGSQKTGDKDGSVITEQLQVADTVKNEKEAEAGADTDNQAGMGDSYDEEEEDGKDKTKSLTKGKDGDGKHYEDEYDEIGRMKFEADNPDLYKEDSLDKMRDQMERGI